MSWSPRLGGWLESGGARFRVWAPAAGTVAVRVERGAAAGEHRLTAEADGHFSGAVGSVRAGDRYRYVLDGAAAYPDPASRWQPEGVHGPSAIVDPSVYRWQDGEWEGVPIEELVLYEMHVGTFTQEGNFASAAARLSDLASLGVSAVQLMPLADFPGGRNWGYDGVDLFAPARCYGSPDELRALVDEAHRVGLAVILDVVYNHFGPDGAYQRIYSPHYFTDQHRTPWGAGINLDGRGSEAVRSYFIESALHWLHEYHVDGFRLDSTSSLVDDGPEHFLAEYARRLHDEAPAGRRPLLIAEDHRNLVDLVRPRNKGGYGFDAILADDFHHELRRLLAGDHEGYYQDYSGSTANLATNLNRGWLYTGERSPYWQELRGTDPAGTPLPRFAHCIQNHDQVGNRAFGDRLHHAISLEAYRAASVVLLCSAATPLLFMGQEWAASSPFQFFTDHNPELGKAVTEGRRAEFRAWSAFRSPQAREQIPDPQAQETFERSTLNWTEREAEPHASTLRLYQSLLNLRRSEPALRWQDDATQHAVALDADTLLLRRNAGDATLVAIVRLRGGPATVTPAVELLPEGHWERLLSTEDGPFADEPTPIDLEPVEGTLRLRFERPGAVIVRAASS